FASTRAGVAAAREEERRRARRSRRKLRGAVAAGGLGGFRLGGVPGEGASGVSEERTEAAEAVPEAFVGAVGSGLGLLPEGDEEAADLPAVEPVTREGLVELAEVVGDGAQVLALGVEDLAAPVVDAVDGLGEGQL